MSLVRFALAVLVLPCLAACGGPGPADRGPDDGPDEGPPPTPDVGPDLGPVGPGWTPVEGSNGCAEIAANPALVREPFEIFDCSAGQPAPCSEIRRDWDAGVRLIVLGSLPGLDGSESLHALGFRSTTSDSAMIVDSSGMIRQAFRFPLYPGRCTGGVLLAPTRIVVGVDTFLFDGTLGARFIEFSWPSMEPGPIVVMDDPIVEGIPDLMITDDVIGFRARPGDVWRVDSAGRYARVGEGAFLDGVVGDAVLFSSSSTEGPLEVRIADSAGIRSLFPGAPGVEITRSRTDGATFAWHSLSDRVAGRQEWETVEIHLGEGSLEALPSGNVVWRKQTSSASRFLAAGDGRALVSDLAGTMLLRSDGTAELSWPLEDHDEFPLVITAFIANDVLGTGVGFAGVVRTYRWYQLEPND